MNLAIERANQQDEQRGECHQCHESPTGLCDSCDVERLEQQAEDDDD